MNDIFDDMFDDIADDAAVLETLDNADMKTLSSAVRRLRQIEMDLESAEQHLKYLKGQKHNVSSEVIPQLMDQMGVERVDVDGLTCTKKQVVHASIPQDRKQEAFEWLREQGCDDIIKNDVTVSFGRGKDNEVGHILGLLRKMGHDPEQKTQVHPMTLKAFVRERVENGKPIDLDMFGAFISNVAQIKRK